MKRVILLSDFRTLSDLFSEVSRQAAVELPAPFLRSTHFNGPGILCREEEPAEPQPSPQHTPSLFMFVDVHMYPHGVQRTRFLLKKVYYSTAGLI